MKKKETIQVKKTAGSGITLKDVQDKFIVIQNQNVLLDSDVAALYGVETKRINEAVKNNPDKFPEGYVIELTESEKQEVITNCDNLRSKFLTANSKNTNNEGIIEVVEIFDHLGKLKFSPVLPKAFTEKGCYMLATILKSEKATDTTFAIIEAFDKLIELKETG